MTSDFKSPISGPSSLVVSVTTDSDGVLTIEPNPLVEFVTFQEVHLSEEEVCVRFTGHAYRVICFNAQNPVAKKKPYMKAFTKLCASKDETKRAFAHYRDLGYRVSELDGHVIPDLQVGHPEFVTKSCNYETVKDPQTLISGRQVFVEERASNATPAEERWASQVIQPSLFGDDLSIPLLARGSTKLFGDGVVEVDLPRFVPRVSLGSLMIPKALYQSRRAKRMRKFSL